MALGFCLTRLCSEIFNALGRQHFCQLLKKEKGRDKKQQVARLRNRTTNQSGFTTRTLTINETSDCHEVSHNQQSFTLSTVSSYGKFLNLQSKTRNPIFFKLKVSATSKIFLVCFLCDFMSLFTGDSQQIIRNKW